MLPDILIKRGGEGVSHVFLQNNGYVLEKNVTLEIFGLFTPKYSFIADTWYFVTM